MSQALDYQRPVGGLRCPGAGRLGDPAAGLWPPRQHGPLHPAPGAGLPARGPPHRRGAVVRPRRRGPGLAPPRRGGADRRRLRRGQPVDPRGRPLPVPDRGRPAAEDRHRHHAALAGGGGGPSRGGLLAGGRVPVRLGRVRRARTPRAQQRPSPSGSNARGSPPQPQGETGVVGPGAQRDTWNKRSSSTSATGTASRPNRSRLPMCCRRRCGGWRRCATGPSTRGCRPPSIPATIRGSCARSTIRTGRIRGCTDW